MTLGGVGLLQLLVLNALSSPHALTTQTPPRNPVRVGWSLEWCDCGLPPSGDFHPAIASSDTPDTNSPFDADVRGGGGVQASDPAANGTLLIVWPDGGDPSEGVNITYNNGVPTWITWSRPMRSVQWRCTGAHTVGSTSLPTSSRVWSVQVLSRPKHEIGCGGKLSGRLRFVGWDTDSNSTKTTTSSVVYSSGESGYFCIKIPVLLRTIVSGVHKLTLARPIDQHRRSHSRVYSTIRSSSHALGHSLDHSLSCQPLTLVAHSLLCQQPLTRHSLTHLLSDLCTRHALAHSG